MSEYFKSLELGRSKLCRACNQHRSNATGAAGPKGLVIKFSKKFNKLIIIKIDIIIFTIIYLFFEK